MPNKMPLFWLPLRPRDWYGKQAQTSARYATRHKTAMLAERLKAGRELSIARLETMIAELETMVAKSETNYSTATGKNGMTGKRGKKIRGECMTTVTPLLSTIIQNIMI